MEKILKRSKQLTGAYCGPTVFQMMVSAFGLDLDQEKLVDATDKRKTVMRLGIPLADLAKGLKKIYPELMVWVKREANLKDIEALLAQGYFVGVDWQGIFEKDEYKDYQTDKLGDYWDKLIGTPELKGEQGHYCIALELDIEKGFLRFADPYGHYAGKDRFVATWEFEERWWDDRVGVGEAGKKVRVVENRLMFLVTKKGDKVPETVGMVEVL